MHDVLEGIGPFEVKLVLANLEQSDIISLRILNNRVVNFPYGQTDAKNHCATGVKNLSLEKSEKKSLNLKALQFWAFLRLLPIMIGDLIPRGNKFWLFYLELRDLCDILFAQKWTLGNLDYFRVLLSQHLEHFKQLFPEHQLIPKHHFLVHYATFVAECGPVYRTMVATKEMKMNYFKRIAHGMCNFQNVPKSLASRHQMFACYCLSSGKILTETPEMLSTVMVSVGQLPCSEELVELLKDVGSLRDEICVAKKIIVCGQVYCDGMVVILPNLEPDEFLNFGRIYGSVMDDDNSAYFIVRKLITLCFDAHFHSYECTFSDNYCLVQHRNLLDYHPLDYYKIPLIKNRVFVALRYNVF